MRTKNIFEKCKMDLFSGISTNILITTWLTVVWHPIDTRLTKPYMLTFPPTCWDVGMKNIRVCWIPSSSHGERSLANQHIWLIHNDWINGWSTARWRTMDDPLAWLWSYWNVGMKNTQPCWNPSSSRGEPFLSSWWIRDIFSDLKWIILIDGCSTVHWRAINDFFT